MLGGAWAAMVRAKQGRPTGSRRTGARQSPARRTPSSVVEERTSGAAGAGVADAAQSRFRSRGKLDQVHRRRRQSIASPRRARAARLPLGHLRLFAMMTPSANVIATCIGKRCPSVTTQGARCACAAPRLRLRRRASPSAPARPRGWWRSTVAPPAALCPAGGPGNERNAPLTTSAAEPSTFAAGRASSGAHVTVSHSGRATDEDPPTGQTVQRVANDWYRLAQARGRSVRHL